MTLIDDYKQIRAHSEEICRPLQTEDYVVQPVVDVSPPKWHLGHTTWFFETFILCPYLKGYEIYNPDYNYVFNSYYETIGNRVIRTDRGNLSRPGVAEVYQYRSYVDQAMVRLMEKGIDEECKELLILGFHHEQQHQELLLTDIKYILGHNPLFPAYTAKETEPTSSAESVMHTFKEGIYEIGFSGQGFCFDNELNRHKVYLNAFSISANLVSNREYLEFVNEGGYRNFIHWHAEGWDWVKNNQVVAPLYWHLIDGVWYHYTLGGLKLLNQDEALSHISYYEAYAYASWKGMRLPTEFEWETASSDFEWGQRWEWTESAYLP